MPSNPGGAVVVGRVVKPHGVEGEVVVELKTDFVDRRFSAGNIVQVEAPAGRKRLTVNRAREHSDRLIVEFEQISDRDEAEALRGSTLCVSREDVVELPPGEFYGFQVVGLEFCGVDIGRLGSVKDVWSTGNRTFLEVSSAEHGTLDFPAEPELIREVDVESGRMVVDLPEGWQKLARS